jgi:hypothetical protein
MRVLMPGWNFGHVIGIYKNSKLSNLISGNNHAIFHTSAFPSNKTIGGLQISSAIEFKLFDKFWGIASLTTNQIYFKTSEAEISNNLIIKILADNEIVMITLHFYIENSEQENGRYTVIVVFKDYYGYIIDDFIKQNFNVIQI